MLFAVKIDGKLRDRGLLLGNFANPYVAMLGNVNQDSSTDE